MTDFQINILTTVVIVGAGYLYVKHKLGKLSEMIYDGPENWSDNFKRKPIPEGDTSAIDQSTGGVHP